MHLVCTGSDHCVYGNRRVVLSSLSALEDLITGFVGRRGCVVYALCTECTEGSDHWLRTEFTESTGGSGSLGPSAGKGLVEGLHCVHLHWRM